MSRSDEQFKFVYFLRRYNRKRTLRFENSVITLSNNWRPMFLKPVIYGPLYHLGLYFLKRILFFLLAYFHVTGFFSWRLSNWRNPCPLDGETYFSILPLFLILNNWGGITVARHTLHADYLSPWYSMLFSAI